MIKTKLIKATTPEFIRITPFNSHGIRSHQSLTKGIPKAYRLVTASYACLSKGTTLIGLSDYCYNTFLTSIHNNTKFRSHKTRWHSLSRPTSSLACYLIPVLSQCVLHPPGGVSGRGSREGKKAPGSGSGSRFIRNTFQTNYSGHLSRWLEHVERWKAGSTLQAYYLMCPL